MKKLSKRILTSVVLTVIMMLCLTGCTKTKTYTVGEFSIKLPEGFEETTLSSYSADVVLKSDSVVLFAINETEHTLKNYTAFTPNSLKDFAEFSHSAYQMVAETGKLTERKGYYYFSIPRDSEGPTLYCMFENNGTYWSCTFVSRSKDYGTDEMLKWADSIKFK